MALRGLAFDKALKKPSGSVPQLGKSVFGDREEWEGVSRKWCSVPLGLRGLHWGRCYEGPRLKDCRARRAAEALNTASRGCRAEFGAAGEGQYFGNSTDDG